MSLTCSRIGLTTAAVLLAVLGPLEAAGQQRGQATPATGWAPISVGLRFGYDDKASSEIAGAQLHIPVVPSGRITFLPNANITFLTRLREYQLNLEAVYVTGGRRGGPYAGGGIGWRNSIFGTGTDGVRSTVGTYSAVIGAKGGFGIVETQIELRWVFIDEAVFNPRIITFGLNFPLWGRRSDS